MNKFAVLFISIFPFFLYKILMRRLMHVCCNILRFQRHRLCFPTGMIFGLFPKTAVLLITCYPQTAPLSKKIGVKEGKEKPLCRIHQSGFSDSEQVNLTYLSVPVCRQSSTLQVISYLGSAYSTIALPALSRT